MDNNFKKYFKLLLSFIGEFNSNPRYRALDLVPKQSYWVSTISATKFYDINPEILSINFSELNFKKHIGSLADISYLLTRLFKEYNIIPKSSINYSTYILHDFTATYDHYGLSYISINARVSNISELCVSDIKSNSEILSANECIDVFPVFKIHLHEPDLTHPTISDITAHVLFSDLMLNELFKQGKMIGSDNISCSTHGRAILRELDMYTDTYTNTLLGLADPHPLYKMYLDFCNHLKSFYYNATLQMPVPITMNNALEPKPHTMTVVNNANYRSSTTLVYRKRIPRATFNFK